MLNIHIPSDLKWFMNVWRGGRGSEFSSVLAGWFSWPPPFSGMVFFAGCSHGRSVPRSSLPMQLREKDRKDLFPPPLVFGLAAARPSVPDGSGGWLGCRLCTMVAAGGERTDGRRERERDLLCSSLSLWMINGFSLVRVREGKGILGVFRACSKEEERRRAAHKRERR